jgi:hypothetical protein
VKKICLLVGVSNKKNLWQGEGTHNDKILPLLELPPSQPPCELK